MGNMPEAITTVLQSSPVAIVLYWMVKVFQKQVENKDVELREMRDKLVEVVENNTRAVTNLESTTRKVESVNDKIYDVLSRR